MACWVILLLLWGCEAELPGWSQGLGQDASQEAASARPLIDFDFSNPSFAEIQPAVAVPPVVGGRILTAVAQTQGIALDKLQITASRDRQWRDSCLSILTPDQVCAQVITLGWQAIVSDGRQDWVYHSDRAGELVRWNGRASETGAQISLTALARLGQLDGSVLSVLAWSRPEKDADIGADGNGMVNGMTTAEPLGWEVKALLIDGSVVDIDSEGRIAAEISKLGSGQLGAFDQQRNDANLAQFDGLRYGEARGAAVKSAATRTVTWVTLLDSQGVVQYDATSVTQLPPELQALNLAWQAIAQESDR